MNISVRVKIEKKNVQDIIKIPFELHIFFIFESYVNLASHVRGLTKQLNINENI